MLDGGAYNITCDMSIAEEGYGRCGDDMWFQQPISDGGALSMSNASGT